MGLRLEKSSSGADHGGLKGLADDDHIQYLLVDGSRPISADWDNIGERIRNTGTVEVSSSAPLTPAVGLLWLDTSQALTGVPDPRVRAYRTVTEDYTIVGSDETVYIDASSNDVIITMLGASIVAGYVFRFKRIDNSSFSATITNDIAEEDADTGEIFISLTPRESADLESDNVEWQRV